MQFRNGKRVVFGKDSNKLRKEFEKDYVNDFKQRRLRVQQRLTKVKEFQNVCMNGNYKDPEKYSVVTESNNNLSISPKNSRIITVLLSFLEGIFQRNRSLVGNDGLVPKKPGATDGS